MTGDYDNLMKLVIESYARTDDVRETASELNLTLDVVLDMLGLKDKWDFEK